jgi:hypothetical protein
MMFSLALLMTGACGGDDGSPDKPDAAEGGAPDASVDAPPDAAPAPKPDAAPNPNTPDAAPAPCVVPTEGYGDLGAVTMEAGLEDGEIFGLATLTVQPETNLMVLLRGGAGVFAGGSITTGTFTLDDGGDDGETCGACAVVFGSLEEEGDIWVASGGTIVLTSVEGQLTGSLQNVSFTHRDGDSGAVLNDGCTTSLVSATFNAPIETGKGRPRKP